jgi:hypothetical protein
MQSISTELPAIHPVQASVKVMGAADVRSR